MNIYDASEHTGVSIATVSRVFNGNPDVNEETRERVLKAIDELGYTPDMFARSLGLNTIRVIGIMCSDSSDPYLAGAVYYLERRLCLHGYDVTLCCTNYDLDARQKYFGLLHSKWVDAIILAGSKFVETRAKDNAYIIEAASDLPIMLANGFLEGENIYSTVCGDHAVTYGAASQLLSYGHRRILYIYANYSYSGVNKLVGYKDALKVKSVTPSGEFIRQRPKDIEAARGLLLPPHGEGLEFGAIITSDGSLAVGAIKYAHIAGISIPRGLSITGYNNSLLARCTDPEITSIDSKAKALCTATINTLMRIFNGVDVPSRTAIASDLIKGKTTNF